MTRGSLARWLALACLIAACTWLMAANAQERREERARGVALERALSGGAHPRFTDADRAW